MDVLAAPLEQLIAQCSKHLLMQEQPHTHTRTNKHTPTLLQLHKGTNPSVRRRMQPDISFKRMDPSEFAIKLPMLDDKNVANASTDWCNCP